MRKTKGWDVVRSGTSTGYVGRVEWNSEHPDIKDFWGDQRYMHSIPLSTYGEAKNWAKTCIRLIEGRDVE